MQKMVLGILLLLIQVHFCCCQQEVYRNETLKEGETFQLECQLNSSVFIKGLVINNKTDSTNIFVTFNESANTCSFDAPSKDSRYNFTCDEINHILNIELHNVTKYDHNITFNCQESNKKHTITILYVEVPLKYILIEPNTSLTLEEDEERVIQCRTSPSFTQTNVQWHLSSKKPNETLEFNMTQIQVEGGLIETKSNLKYKGNPKDNGQTIYCTADDGIVKTPVESNHLQLNILYGPNRITFNDDLDKVEVKEGDSISVTCSADCNPKCNHQWLDNKEKIVHGNTIQLKEATLDMTGNYTCNGTNELGSMTRVLPVIIQYIKINISTTYDTCTEGNKTRLQCYVEESVPPNIRFLDWEHNIGSKFIRNITGNCISDGDNVLEFKNCSYMDIGNYTCRVKNDVGIVATERVALEIRAKPVIVRVEQTSFKNKGNDSLWADINVYIYSVPPPDNFSWYIDDEVVLVENSLFRQNVESTGVTLNVYNKTKIRVKGICSQLSVSQKAAKHDSMFKIRVQNEIGETMKRVKFTQHNEMDDEENNESSKTMVLLEIFIFVPIMVILMIIAIGIAVILHKKRKRNSAKEKLNQLIERHIEASKDNFENPLLSVNCEESLNKEKQQLHKLGSSDSLQMKMSSKLVCDRFRFDPPSFCNEQGDDDVDDNNDGNADKSNGEDKIPFSNRKSSKIEETKL